jgi:hypothetical protein
MLYIIMFLLCIVFIPFIKKEEIHSNENRVEESGW